MEIYVSGGQATNVDDQSQFRLPRVGLGTRLGETDLRRWATRLLVHVAVDDRRPIDAIGRLCREQFRLEKALTETVLIARGQGYSWKEVGEAINSTRQAAWLRFARGPMAEQLQIAGA